jgi:hypothetical protein
MRRFKRTYIVVGLALLATLAFAATSWAPHPGHVFRATFTPTPPKGFPKGKPQPGALHVELIGADDPATPNQNPPRATQIDLDVDKSVKLSGKGLAQCTHGPPSVGGDGALEGTPTTGPGSAQALCGNEAPDKDDNALIGTGTATATLQNGVVLPATVVAFNGTNNSVLVHVRVDPISTTVVVPGPIGQAPDQSLYGQRVSFLPPSLAGGAASLSSISLELTRIEKIKKGEAGASASKKKKKKKYASIVSGKCTDGTYNFQNVEEYADHETITEPITQPCTKK